MKIIIGNPKADRGGFAAALLTGLFILCAVGMAGADDRALLVGVGTYKVGVTLPGIDKDLEMMTEAVQLMGFKESRIKILKDSDATLENIREALARWLVEGVGPEDRVLFYFSGHGSQVKDRKGETSDEADGADEVLCPYDVGREGEKLTNALLDDDFGKLLSAIPAGRIFVFLDACHSGTATRDLPLAPGEMAPKFFEYPGMPRTKSIFALEETAGNDKYIALSACEDDEKALASSKGSLFTRGILSAPREAVKLGKEITMAQLKDKTALFISKNLKKSGAVQHPVISGNTRLENINLIESNLDSAGVGTDAGEVDPWSRLKELAARAAYGVEASANKQRYRVGDTLEIACRVKKEGYVNIINASPADKEAVVLFPNRLHPGNRVDAHATITIPAGGDPFTLRARPPVGQSMVVVFHTRRKINAHQDGRGGAQDLYKRLSLQSLKDLELAEKEDHEQFGAKIIITEVY